MKVYLFLNHKFLSSNRIWNCSASYPNSNTAKYLWWIDKTFTFNFKINFTLVSFKKGFFEVFRCSGFMTIVNVCCHLFVLVSLFSVTGLLKHKLPHIAQTLKIKIGSVVKQKLLQEHSATKFFLGFLSRGFIAASGQTEYCTTFPCMTYICVSVLVTGVTSQVFQIIWLFRPCKPYAMHWQT